MFSMYSFYKKSMPPSSWVFTQPSIVRSSFRVDKHSLLLVIFMFVGFACLSYVSYFEWRLFRRRVHPHHTSPDVEAIIKLSFVENRGSNNKGLKVVRTKQERNERSSCYARRLMSKRSWVRIQTLDTRLIFFTICCKICIVCLNRLKINKKYTEDCTVIKR